MMHDGSIRTRTHDDGVNAWTMIDIFPPSGLAGLIHRYNGYRKRTGGFTIRRELPQADGVTPSAYFASNLPDGGGLVEARGAFRPILAVRHTSGTTAKETANDP